MIVITLLLSAGEASAVSGCDILANVQDWNGSISFSYSNIGSKSAIDPYIGTYEWNIQRSTDARFKLRGFNMEGSARREYSSILEKTGVANTNDMLKITDNVGYSFLDTAQGSGSPSKVVDLLVDILNRI